MKNTEADKWFSRYQRLRHSDLLGMCRCSTCPSTKHWKHMHWGHYIPRARMATRFDYRNGGVQCEVCNNVFDGNPKIMRLYLVHKYGEDVVSGLADKEFVYCDVKRVARIYRRLHQREKRKRLKQFEKWSSCRI